MIQLSGTIITFNEEKNIRRCLESLKDVTDELVVVDSGSTDNTVAICREFNATVIYNPFNGFVEQKNFAYSKTNGQWILLLDADEELSAEAIDSIRNVLKNPDCDGYSFNRLTYYCGRWIKSCGWYPDTKLRLFKKGTGEWKGQNPHDKLELFKGHNHRKLQGNILHYSYTSLSDHVNRANKYATIAAKTMHEKGVKISLSGIIIKANARFIKSYFLRRGFTDGLPGLMISVVAGFEVFLKYARLYLMNKKNNELKHFSE